MAHSLNVTTGNTGAEYWIEKLLAERLPAIAGTGAQVLEVLQSSSPPYHRLARLISRDPVIAFHIGRGILDVSGSRPQSLEHGISILGLEKLERIVRDIPYYKPDAAHISHCYSLRALNTSLLAATTAACLSRQKMQWDSIKMFWAALFLNASDWHLWHFASAEMRMVRFLVRHEELAELDAEQQVFGCHVQEISQGLLEHASLVDLAEEALKSELFAPHCEALAAYALEDEPPYFSMESKEERELVHVKNKPAFVVWLCNALAREALRDWYSEKTLSQQKVLAATMGVSLNQMITLTHHCAVESSRTYCYDGVMCPAAKLFLSPGEYLRVDSFSEQIIGGLLISSPITRQIYQSSGVAKKAAECKHPTKEKQRPAPDTSIRTEANTEDPHHAALRMRKLDVFEQLLRNLALQPESYRGLPAFMSDLIKGTDEGLGLKLSSISLVSKDKRVLRTCFASDELQASSLSKYRCALGEKTVFDRMLKKPTSLWVKSFTKKELLSAIPTNFRQCAPESFFLSSVVLNNKPIAIIFAAVAPAEPALGPWEFTQFKRLAPALTECLRFHARQENRKVAE